MGLHGLLQGQIYLFVYPYLNVNHSVHTVTKFVDWIYWTVLLQLQGARGSVVG
jgi:hypothetical protein